MGKWMAGFSRAMGEATDQNLKNSMLGYLISLLDDSNYFSWSSAKASHAVLLCCMGQGEIKDFTVTDKIDRVRRAHAQRHTLNDQDASKKPAKHNHSKAMACHIWECALNRTLTKRKVFFTSMYVLFVWPRMGEIFHILKLGVGLPSHCAQRYFWSKTLKINNAKNELMVKSTALHWFRVSKAYGNFHDDRTYAQVLA